MDELFKGRHFDREIIVLCVRWYLRYKLSFRDLVEMMAERGLSLAHTTIMRWIQHYAPEFEKRWNRFARPAGRSWRVDETYVKIKGRWTYLYRAVDKEGRTVDFLLRAKRDVAAAKAFFRLAFRRQGRLPRRLSGLTSRSQRGPGRTSRGKSMQDQIVKIFEQFDRTGSSIRQASARSDARPQAFPPSRNDDRRHRTHASDPQGSVQTR